MTTVVTVTKLDSYGGPSSLPPLSAGCSEDFILPRPRMLAVSREACVSRLERRCRATVGGWWFVRLCGAGEL